MKKLLLATALLIASTLSANAVIISGNYTLSSTSDSTITYILGQPFSFDLTLNVATEPTTLATIYENSAGSRTITAAFSFSDPTVASASLTGSDVYSLPGNSAHDTLSWNNNGLLVVNFSNGAILDIMLAGDSYNGNSSRYDGVDPMVTFKLVKAPTQLAQTPTAAPEPWTLSLFAAGLVALGGMTVLRRRRDSESI